MKRFLTCIVCPMGCKIEAEINDGKIEYIKGNTCARGAKYASDECINPVRTITSTVKCSGGGVVSVKTDAPVPKEKIFECMDIINNAEAVLPISVGDVIIENILGTHANVTATQNKQKR